ncbi:MAG: hypothetical protein MUD09_08070 [Desulfobacterales bacterium]|jgi:hypothetical protein|nr:hypothetical protein [Desulfobacterales bacterium]
MTTPDKKAEDKKNDDIVSPKDSSKKEETPVIFPDLPDDMPHEAKQIIRMAMMSSSATGMSRHHPLFEKFTEDHVHKYLDYIQKDDDNEFSFRSSNRWFYLLYTVLGLCFFSFLVIYLLPKDKGLLDEILKLLVAFAGGLGSGYGIKAFKDKKK